MSLDWDYGKKGYEPRDWDEYPEFTMHLPYSGRVFPRKEWPELIRLQEKNETSPWHIHVGNKIPVRSQGRYGFCWCWGTVNCVLNRYAAQGIDPVPDLNAHATAAMIKRYRNKGGFAGEATRGIEKYGIPTRDVWPDHSMDKRLENKPEVIESCKKHKLVTFQEFPRDDFDAVVSCLLDPVDPSPCTLALSWWRHLVAGLQVVRRDDGVYGIKIVNSWGTQWGENGYGVLWGEKAIPFESIAVRSVKATTEEKD